MLFKAIGLILILTVCTSVGFLKAFSLKTRVERLCDIKKGLLTLKEHLRLHSGNKRQLLTICFDAPPESFNDLKSEDIALWNEFLREFGMTDTQSEIRRCESYIFLFEDRLNDAKKSLLEQQKLYKSLGFLCGIFICIFLI